MSHHNRTPSDTYAIVNTILRRGNEPGLITEWFAGMKEWADANAGPDAAALRLWLAFAKPQPFYTAQNLSLLWPALKLTLGLASRMEAPPSANRLANELEFCGLPVLMNDQGGHSFFGPDGRPATYFVVEHCHKWKGVRLSQADFDEVLLGA